MLELLQEVLAFIAGFMTTFCLGYIIWKENND